MANKRTGYAYGKKMKEAADNADNRLRRMAADKQFAKNANVRSESIKSAKFLRDEANKNPNAFIDNGSYFYRGRSETYKDYYDREKGLNDVRGTQKQKQYAKEVLEKAFDEDKKKKKTK